MDIEIGKSIHANLDNQDMLNEFVRTMRREGNILERWDAETSKGYKSGFFIEYSGFEYLVRMLNGEVTTMSKIWEV